MLLSPFIYERNTVNKIKKKPTHRRQDSGVQTYGWIDKKKIVIIIIQTCLLSEGWIDKK